MTLTSVDRLGRGSVRANRKGVCLLGARGKQKGVALDKGQVGQEIEKNVWPTTAENMLK